MIQQGWALVALHVVHVLETKLFLRRSCYRIFIASVCGLFWQRLPLAHRKNACARAWLRSFLFMLACCTCCAPWRLCGVAWQHSWGDRNRVWIRDSNPKPGFISAFTSWQYPCSLGDWAPVVGHELAALACGFLEATGESFSSAMAAC